MMQKKEKVLKFGQIIRSMKVHIQWVKNTDMEFINGLMKHNILVILNTIRYKVKVHIFGLAATNTMETGKII